MEESVIGLNCVLSSLFIFNIIWLLLVLLIEMVEMVRKFFVE